MAPPRGVAAGGGPCRLLTNSGSHGYPMSIPEEKFAPPKSADVSRPSPAQLDAGGQINVDVSDIDLHSEATRTSMLALYYKFCKESTGLSVTTSCFTEWKKSGRLNGCAKVIPAMRCDCDESDRVRIFFFDDNVTFDDGYEHSKGICNLRDVSTGDFINFGEGQNGFAKEFVGKHTVVHHSSQYRNVIVKANILDALEDCNYFTNIVDTYVQPGEKVIVFVDVNSTIMCNDTSADKDLNANLLSVMFELIEFKPTGAVDLLWRDASPVKVQKTMTLKQLVKEVTQCDHEAYSLFWQLATCVDFIDELLKLGKVQWSSQAGSVSGESFLILFHHYLKDVSDDLVQGGGIASGWFHFFAFLQQRSAAVVLNSFGVDTNKVVVSTVASASTVKNITVNYDTWDDRDKRKFQEQYSACSSPSTAVSWSLAWKGIQCSVGLTA
eukprot:TRINITY_DN46453_c0_g1_i1.p1 TRINITY_DN46453_c0_g1~~TRINITY_DN46453_c0_g1_i1.p1  ORF type:complete len:438 (+),score=77.77 TRINITY_DN46453_c0_g1_i1:116-1429(+)